MKKKNIIIMGITFIVLLIAVIIIALMQKRNQTLYVNKSSSYYEVIENSGTMFKGISVVSDEQTIFLDNALTLEQLHIEDKQEVKKGDVVLTYTNEAVQEQIDSLQLQYNLTNDKLNRSIGNKGEIQSDITQKEQSINKKIDLFNSLDDIENIDEKTSLNQQITVEEQELQVLKSNLQGEESAITTLNDSLKELSEQIEVLKNKLTKEVAANIDGIAYISKEGLNNVTAPYITIVSKEPLVKCTATEYDVLSLSVGQEMILKVVSTGEEIKGTITSIDDLPSTSQTGTSVVYNFNVKPERDIRIGFSVEIKENIETLEIPKDYVSEEEGNLFVAKVTDTGLEKIEIKGTLEDDYYVISSDKIAPGDKLSSNPLEALKEE